MDIIPDFGKYSLYIWLSYGVSVAVLLGFTVYTFVQNARRKK